MLTVHDAEKAPSKKDIVRVFVGKRAPQIAKLGERSPVENGK
jgi:hypothetical protein